MSQFRPAGDASFEEFLDRKNRRGKILSFGVSYLDDAMRGIFTDDMVLVGAPSGQGKTQLCCNMAIANMRLGHKVYYIALEAGKFEIERRIKFPIVFDLILKDPNRPSVGRITYAKWLAGDFEDKLEKYDIKACEIFEREYRDLFLFYKQDKFGKQELVDSILMCADQADMIIIDHVHFFDFDDDNENRALKEIAKLVRRLSQEQQKPIVLVAHLRKRDKSRNEEICGDLDEFHGSSDLTKIATKAFTFSSGGVTPDGLCETFFRIGKNRDDMSVTKFLGRAIFNPKTRKYDDGYKVGWASSTKGKFGEIDRAQYPEWARGDGVGIFAAASSVGLRKPLGIGEERLQAVLNGHQRNAMDERE